MEQDYLQSNDHRVDNEQDYLYCDDHDVDNEQDYLHCDDHDVDNGQGEEEQEELLLNFKGSSKGLEINNIILYAHYSSRMVKIKLDLHWVGNDIVNEDIFI